MIFEEFVRKLLKDTTSLEATPLFSLGPYPAISYKHTPISGGLLPESQLEVRIIGNDYDELLEIKQKVVKALDMTDDIYKRYDGMSYHSELAGGGDLFDDSIQMWECISLFTVTWRCL